jgi:acyl-coenzyme A synthetase/AMP-(fatty) acid ligase
MTEHGLHALPLLHGAPLDAPLAWHHGAPVSRRQYLADVAALVGRLPANGPVLTMAADRYRFAVALGASMRRGHRNLLPPNHTPDTVTRLRALHPTAYALVEPDGPSVDMPQQPIGVFDGRAADAAVPHIDAESVVAQVYTSGSTGTPTQHDKAWGLLVQDAHEEATRLAESMRRPDLQGVTLVGTVPHHHMYGFESTVLLALREGAAFATERPFFAADIVRTLNEVPRPRALVTTPFHLKALLDSGLDLPAVDLIVSATAPLSPQMAARAETMLHAPLIEIYGCTEAGQVATRRTTEGPEWLTFDGLCLSGDGEHCSVSGGHVPVPTPLSDVLEVISPTRFRLLGRNNDLINVAGKRSSLSHLNHHLNSIEGVRDGAFWLPPATTVEGVARLVVFVVAPGLPRETLMAELRHRIDPAMLPRRIVAVDALPRDATGKLPAARLAELARDLLSQSAGPSPNAD